MSLKRNVAANYAGQVYAGLVGIAVVPLYLRIMGTEVYGLVGFFALLQAWAQLLDLGMSATMARETARFRAGSLDAQTLRRLLRTLECVFWPLGVLLALLLGLSSPAIAAGWLKISALNRSDAQLAIVLMAASIALRWVSGLYRGVMTGLERQVWLNAFNAAVASLRFLGVIPVLLLANSGPVTFFLFQGVVSVLEVAALVSRTNTLVPLEKGAPPRASLSVLRSVVHFSAMIALATVLWVVLTQADKLMLSAILPLAEYGYYSATVLIASAVTILSAAISQAVLPRLTALSEQADQSAFIELYRHSTQWTTVIAGPLSLALASLAEPILWAWTGDRMFASTYAPVLAWYSIGNGFMTLAAFPFYLQYANGDLRLHVGGNVVFSAVLLPAVLYASLRHGALGAGWVWAWSNAAFFIFWTPIVHRRFLPGLHRQWLLHDVVRVLGLPAVLGLLAAQVPLQGMGRMASALTVTGLFCVLVLAALWMSELARPRLRLVYRRLVG